MFKRELWGSMNKHNFSDTERFTIYTADEGKCFWCGIPLIYRDVHVDHVFPESLLDEPVKLQQVRGDFALGEDFNINGFENWVTSHQGCNGPKNDSIIVNVPKTLDVLRRLRARSPRLEKFQQKFITERETSNALGRIVRFISSGIISKEHVIAFINNKVEAGTPARRSDPLVFSFSVNVIELDTTDLPQAALSGPALYDWLITELENYLSEIGAMFSRVDDDRNGETVSLRLACWMIDVDQLPFPLPHSWELMAVDPLSEIDTSIRAEDLLASSIVAKYQDLTLDETSSDPLPYTRCILCGSRELQRFTTTLNGADIYTIRCKKCEWCERSWA